MSEKTKPSWVENNIVGIIGVALALPNIGLSPSILDMANPLVAFSVVLAALVSGAFIGWWWHGRRLDSEIAKQTARQETEARLHREEEERAKTEKEKIKRNDYLNSMEQVIRSLTAEQKILIKIIHNCRRPIQITARTWDERFSRGLSRYPDVLSCEDIGYGIDMIREGSRAKELLDERPSILEGMNEFTENGVKNLLESDSDYQSCLVEEMEREANSEIWQG